MSMRSEPELVQELKRGDDGSPAYTRDRVLLEVLLDLRSLTRELVSEVRTLTRELVSKL